MSTISKYIVMLILVSTTIGCATVEKMEFPDNPGTELDAGKSIYLLSVNLRNTYKPNHQPKLRSILIDKKGSEDSTIFTIPNTHADVLNRLLLLGFTKESDDPKTGNSYLAHIVLEPGQYTLRHLFSESSGLLIWGTFITPIHEDIDVNEPGVYYLGRVNAVVRERVANEFKAGSPIPLLDQSVVGASGGTFDVEIINQWGIDKSAFLTQFPSLRSLNVINAVLPAFDRARAQKYWEDN